MVLPLVAGVVGGMKVVDEKLDGEGQGAENKIQGTGTIDFYAVEKERECGVDDES